MLLMKRILFTLCFFAAAATAQLDSGSNGSDGALTLTTPGEVLLNPSVLSIDVDGDNIFHFTTITIGPGVIVKLQTGPLQAQPVVWLASGAVQIDGTVDLSGQDGHAANELSNRLPATPGPGGFLGGLGMVLLGTSVQSASQAGSGPGGGGNNGCSAGYATFGFCDIIPQGRGATYGNAVLIPLLGGSGGGGGNLSGAVDIVVGGGGGGGGGALRIFSSASVSISGSVIADGGAGGIGSDSGNASVNRRRNGGGASGGGIHLVAPIVSGTGSLFARGGSDGPAGDMHDGSPGRIRIDAEQATFAGGSDPSAIFGFPFNVPLPAPLPSLRVTTVGGVPVPPNPTGSFVTPDIGLEAANAVTVEIEARNVPIGTLVTVHVISDSGPDQAVTASALVGSDVLSNASAEVVFPPGFSRGFAKAVF